eukprot:TRINITY_DN7705_c0_g1_i2.p2 TRINITY_DN7705_c0_g1~~TRINITY_DN7705_c0_g1_i2.p2  ORF type:complete len:337 (-),score=33.83 TRINITY_DN7705_c0_g1_i2:1149-2159(-)
MCIRDRLNSLTPDGTKSIPMRAWSGPVVQKVPHFSDNNGGQTWSITLTGYQFTKFWTRLNEGVQQCTNDAPIFRIEEVMLNYAEAEKELGIFNQSICDQTINKLRTRGGVASLNLSNIPDDPTRDLSVDPVMWEIRRERAVELMGEGFRFNDLRRWKKMDYALERKLGRYIVAADENNKVSILNGANQGYVSYEGQAPTPFPDYYYLYPIPSNEIILSGSALIQNPGWKQKLLGSCLKKQLPNLNKNYPNNQSYSVIKGNPNQCISILTHNDSILIYQRQTQGQCDVVKFYFNIELFQNLQNEYFYFSKVEQQTPFIPSWYNTISSYSNQRTGQNQ